MNSEQKLREALTRLTNGAPINISPERKISPSSVEDEAKVSRSLLRHYPDLHEETVKAKKAQRQGLLSQCVQQQKTEDIDQIKKELDKKKAEVSELRNANDELIRTNADLFILLNAVAHKNRLDFDLEGIVGSVTKVNISDNLRALLK